jgi:NADH-quinone oxidoreductase subunit L
VTLEVVAAVGVATALMAGTIGLAQTDIKRVLAYSTVSQLGFMFLAMGVGAYAAGIFHLYTHAFFKALLFLGSGAVIHALAGEQDLRHMGGLKKYLPVTYWTFLIGALAIAGFPLLSGFFSKDEILYRAFVGTERAHGSFVLWGVASVTALLTAIYMFRLVFLTFHGQPRFDGAMGASGANSASVQGAHVPHDTSPGTLHTGTSGTHGSSHGAPHDAPPSMAIPLIVLAIGSAGAGFVGVPHALGGNNRIESFLEPSFEVHATAESSPAGDTHAPAQAEGEHAAGDVATERMLMALSTGVALAGIGIAWFFWIRRTEAAAALARQSGGLYRFLLNKWYFDEAYDAAIVQPIRQVSTGALWKGMDAGLIDGGVNGVGATVRNVSTVLRRAQTGSVRTYAASLFLGAVAVLGWYLWS